MSTHAIRLKIGAIIVQNGNIIAYGYNGTAPGQDNTCEYKVYTTQESPGYPLYTDPDGKTYKLVTKPEVIHGEANALFKVAKSTASSENADLFLTHAPCIECSKMIKQCGIRNVYYRDVYRSTDGIDFLENNGVNVTKI